MKRQTLSLLLSVAVVSPLHAQTATSAQPQSKWIVDYDEDRCIASRSYEVSGQKWAVAIEPQATSAQTALLLATPAQTAPGPVKLSAAEALPAAGLEATQADGRRLYRTMLSPANVASLSARGAVDVQSGDVAIALPLDGLSAVQGQLKSCVSDLLDSWGVAPPQQATIAAFPTVDRDPASLIRPGERPLAPLRAGATGRSTVLVQVDQRGQPGECVVTQSSGDATLDATTCQIFLERVRFHAARDSSGKPTKAPYVSSIRWTQ